MSAPSKAVVDSWQTAFDSLDSGLKASLISAKGEKLDVLNSVLDEAEQQRKRCLQKRWKIQLHGKVIILRDVFDKIITWVNEFKAVGDVAMQVNQTAASLPWAGVRFLLQAAVSDAHCFESTVHGLESVTFMIARYSTFEAIFMRKSSVVHAEIQSKLTSLYAQILAFLANSVNYFRQSTAMSVLTAKAEDLADFLARMLKGVFQSCQGSELKVITELDIELQKLSRIFDSQIQQEVQSDVHGLRGIVQSLQSPVRRLIDASTVYTKTLHEQEFHNLLKWLSPIPYAQHHSRHSEARLAKSGRWLLSHPQYVAWKTSSSSSLLLLHGIPGSGKTNLVSVVVDSLIDERKGDPLAAPFAYFYCGDSKVGRERADADEIMQCLTKQLAIVDRTAHKIHEQVSLEYERRAAEAKLDGLETPRLRTSDCADLILSVLQSNPATIVIDGVDEVAESRRHELLRSLSRIRDESPSVIKVFLSSRDSSNIFAHLSDAERLRIQEKDTQQDMESYVRHSVSTAIANRNLLDGDVPETMRDDLVRFLLDRAGEMFLWVNLQIQKFCELKSRSSVFEPLRQDSKAPPAAIDRLYSDILDDISRTDSMAYDIATKAFSWLMCMREPLSSDAFLAAVSATSPEELPRMTMAELLRICSNLIVLDSKLDMLRFAHSSFKEFLERRPEFSVPSTNSVAATDCLNTCIHDLPSEEEAELRPDKDFATYSTLYWATHCRDSAINGSPNDCLSSKLNEFVLCEGDEIGLSFFAWLDTVQMALESLAYHHPLRKELGAAGSSTMTPLFTACVYGFEDLIRVIAAKEDFDANQRNALGHTGLYLAAAFGHHETAQFLLQLGADANVQCGKHGSSLNAAAFCGNVALVQLLLNTGNDSMAPNKLESAFQVSRLAGHQDVAKLLLGNTLWISCPDDYNRAVEAISQAGFSEVAQILEKSHPQFSKVTSSSSNLANAAIGKGHLTFLKRYCTKHAIPDHSLATAALYGQTKVVIWCLDEGLDIEREGPFGTPLRTASLMGHERIVGVLLERGADVNKCGIFGDALQAAAIKGHLSVTHVLLQNNADVNNVGGYCGNALQSAAYRGHRDVAEALINAGALITKVGRYKDAFHAAVEGGQEGIIRLFLDRGYSFPPEYSTVSSCKAYRGPMSALRNLLEEASPDRIPDRNENWDFRVTPIRIPLALPPYSLEDVFRCARGNGAKGVPEVHDVAEAQWDTPTARGAVPYNSDALEVAASTNDEKVARLILENRERLNVQSDHIRKALLAASKKGHASVVESITSIEMDLRSYIQESAALAAWYGHIAVLDQLLNYEKNRRLTNQHCFEKEFRINLAYIGRILTVCGSRSGQPASVTRGLQLVEDTEIKYLRAMALREAAIANKPSVIETLQGNDFELHDLLAASRAAGEYGSKSALVCLIRHDHGKKIRDELHCKAFNGAVMRGQTGLVQYLLEQGPESCSPEILDKLFVDAARIGCLDILKLLISKIQTFGTFPLAVNQALDGACAARDKDAVEFLIHAGADVNASVGKLQYPSSMHEHYLAWCSSQCGCAHEWPRTALQACLQAIPERGRNERLAPPETFRNDKEDIVMKQESVMGLLLANGADVNPPTGCGRTPLHSAALNGTEKMVRALIGAGADLHANDSTGGSPLQYAAWREVGSMPIVSALLEAGAEFTIDESEDGFSSPILNASLTLFGFAPSEDPPSLRGYAGMKLQKLDNGRFALSESLEEVLDSGPGAVIRHLLELKPQLHAKDKRFSLLLQMAAAIGDDEYVQLLIERSVDVNHPGHYYGNALTAAAKLGHLNCVQLLVQAGAKVNTIVERHGSPLHAAVREGHLEVVRFLVGHGADVNLRPLPDRFYPSRSLPPMQLAEELCNSAVVNILADAGAERNGERPESHRE